MKKTLYIAITSFQLLNCINIQFNRNIKADIILFDDIPNALNLKTNLEKENIFDKVFLGKQYSKKQNNLKDKIIKFFRLNLFEDYIDGSFNLKDYDEILVDSYDQIKILKKRRDRLYRVKSKIFSIQQSLDYKVYMYDEGIGTYLESYVSDNNEHIKLDGIYLYEPQMAEYFKEEKYKLFTIPKIDEENKDLIALYNRVFAYKNKIDLNNGDVIFFDQAYDNKDVENFLFSQLASQISRVKNNIYVKIHPRSTKDKIDKYVSCGFKPFYHTEVPWEVILLNISNDIEQIAVSSSAICSASICLNTKKYYRSKALYKFIRKSLSLNNMTGELSDNVDHLFTVLAERYSNISIIDNIEEL